MNEPSEIGIAAEEGVEDAILWMGEHLTHDRPWILLGPIADALSGDEVRVRRAKKPDPRADPNPDYKDRPWQAWKKRAESGDLASTQEALAHHRQGGLLGLVPGVHGLSVLDVDCGNPSDLERKYPPLGATKTRRGHHLFYEAPDKRLGNSEWEAEGCSGEVRCSSGYVIVWDPMEFWHVLRTLGEFPPPSNPFPMAVLKQRSTSRKSRDSKPVPAKSRSPRSTTSNHQMRGRQRDSGDDGESWMQAEVVEAYGDGLEKDGSQYEGPCLLCGGHNRFYVRSSGKFYCRKCLPNGQDGDRFRAMVRALGLPSRSGKRQMPPPDWESEKRSAKIDREIAETARARGAVGPDEDADEKIEDAENREAMAAILEGIPPSGASGDLATALTVAVKCGLAYDIGISRAGRIMVYLRGSWFPPDRKGEVSRVAVAELYAHGGGSRLAIIRQAFEVLAGRIQGRTRRITFDVEPHIVGLPLRPGEWKTVLDLTDGTVRRARRSDYVTKAIGAAPDAIPTPTFNACLDTWADGDETRVKSLRRVIASCLVGAQPERALFFFLGPKGSGKSIFGRVVSMLGEDYISALQASDIGAGKQQKADELIYGHFAGRRGMFVPELPASVLRGGFLKAVCGGDIVQARQLYHDPWHFVPVATLILTTNALPGVDLLDPALHDRVRVIQFPESIPEKERKPKKILLTELRRELPGILHSLLPDAAGLISDGMAFAPDHFASNDRAMVERWALSADKLLGFGSLLVVDSQGRIRADELWSRFVAHLKDQGGDVSDWQSNTLSRELNKRGFGSAKKKGSSRYRMGIRWRDDKDE